MDDPGPLRCLSPARVEARQGSHMTAQPERDERDLAQLTQPNTQCTRHSSGTEKRTEVSTICSCEVPSVRDVVDRGCHDT